MLRGRLIPYILSRGRAPTLRMRREARFQSLARALFRPRIYRSEKRSALRNSGKARRFALFEQSESGYSAAALCDQDVGACARYRIFYIFLVLFAVRAVTRREFGEARDYLAVDAFYRFDVARFCFSDFHSVAYSRGISRRISAIGGTKSAAVAASHGKSTHVSWLTSVTKLSTSARPAGFA